MIQMLPETQCHMKTSVRTSVRKTCLTLRSAQEVDQVHRFSQAMYRCQNNHCKSGDNKKHDV